MHVAFHSFIYDFFQSTPPYTQNDMEALIPKVASMGFNHIQVAALYKFVELDGKPLKRLLHKHGLQCNVHYGGIFLAEKLALSNEEYERVQKKIRYAVNLCETIDAFDVSFHPPFFTGEKRDPEIMVKAKKRFIKILDKEVEYACSKGVKIVLESYCYPPFIFEDLQDFTQYISRFTPSEMGILFEVGHLHHMKFDLKETIITFKKRLCDVHIQDATIGGDVRKATHLPIGEGSVNFRHVISSLHDVGYDGPLTLEIKGSEHQIIESKKYLENLLSVNK